MTGEQRQCSGEKAGFSINGAGIVRNPYAKKERKKERKGKDVGIDFTSFTKINSKWVINIKWKAIRLLAITENLGDLG